MLYWLVYECPITCWRTGVLEEVLKATSSDEPAIEKLRKRLDLNEYPGVDKLYYKHVVQCKEGCYEKYISIFKGHFD